MKRYFMLLWVGLLLLGLSCGSPVQSKTERNLLFNGSFEQGLKQWQLFGAAHIVPGVCGRQALAIHGVLQSKTVRVQAGRTYHVSFWYRGKRLRSTVLMDLPPSATWANLSYTFMPVTGRAFVAFEGDGSIDCVTFVLQKE